MVKATIEYDLTDEDSRRSFQLAQLGEQMASVLYHMKFELRSITKHGEPGDRAEGIDFARSKLFDFLTEHGIDPELVL